MGRGDEARVVDPVIEAYKAGIDRTLIRENLRRTPEERILNAMKLQQLAEELRRAGRAARRGR
ncbi:MAG: hypothetical protein EXR72_05250 [Myxococcales bacterium]|nr:hypothetical protein [Myxococcales bacterium]